jgi:ribosome-binding protein aMBF1 (putative translation factor)
MSDQNWQTVTNKKNKEKNINKENNINLIKYDDNKYVNQDWNYITLNKPLPKQKFIQTQKPATSIKINDDGDIIKIKKVSSEMAKQIIDARIAKKWTQIDLAHNSTINIKTINNIEKGGCLYDADVFNKLCKILGIKIERNYIIT